MCKNNVLRTVGYEWASHDDVMTWTHFTYYRSLVWRIHRYDQQIPRARGREQKGSVMQILVGFFILVMDDLWTNDEMSINIYLFVYIYRYMCVTYFHLMIYRHAQRKTFNLAMQYPRLKRTLQLKGLVSYITITCGHCRPVNAAIIIKFAFITVTSQWAR